jgi:hypothetical protein
MFVLISLNAVSRPWRDLQPCVGPNFDFSPSFSLVPTKYLATMAPHENFDNVFKGNTARFSEKAVETAIKTRRKYDGLLFIDRLFKVLGVKDCMSR